MPPAPPLALPRPSRLAPLSCCMTTSGARREPQRSTPRQFVYLSNTGAKTAETVRKKITSAPYRLQTASLPRGTIYTAAMAQVREQHCRVTIMCRLRLRPPPHHVHP